MNKFKKTQRTGTWESASKELLIIFFINTKKLSVMQIYASLKILIMKNW